MFNHSEAGSPHDSLAKSTSTSLKIAEIEEQKSGLHVVQMNLSREQVSILSSDMLQLRQDVLQLQEEVGLASSQDRLRDRVAFLEKEIRVSRDVLCRRMGSLEACIGESAPRKITILADVPSSHAALLGDCTEHKDDHAPLSQRIGSLENEVCGIVDKMKQMSLDLWKSMNDLRQAHMQNGAFQNRVASLENELGQVVQRHNRELGECRTRQDTAAKDFVTLESKHATVAERTTMLEKRFGDAADELIKTSKEHTAMRDGVVQDVQEWRSAMLESFELFKHEVTISANSQAKAIEDVKITNDDNAATHHARYVSVTGRIDLLENMLSEVSETYYTMLTDLQHKHAEVSSTSGALLDRIARVEQQQRDDSGRFTEDLKILQLSRDQFQSRIAEIMDTLDREVRDKADLQAKELADLRQAYREHERARMIASELRREIDSKAALVNKLTRQRAPPSSHQFLPAQRLQAERIQRQQELEAERERSEQIIQEPASLQPGAPRGCRAHAATRGGPRSRTCGTRCGRSRSWRHRGGAPEAAGGQPAGSAGGRAPPRPSAGASSRESSPACRTSWGAGRCGRAWRTRPRTCSLTASSLTFEVPAGGRADARSSLGASTIDLPAAGLLAGTGSGRSSPAGHTGEVEVARPGRVHELVAALEGRRGRPVAASPQDDLLSMWSPMMPGETLSAHGSAGTGQWS
ncbi:unnamed protein product [Prorocentrum cordatum]|uniref:Uncharacterized protein n=1 Tax=Prorocentrum cordatum TaxID=2364126 RepID=A0ABN9SRP5_9DINO|nr:unnamed protein product [Polarella glacialis]